MSSRPVNTTASQSTERPKSCVGCKRFWTASSRTTWRTTSMARWREKSFLLWLVNDDGAVGERRIERSEGIGVDQERSAARMHSEEHQIRVWRCDFDGNRHESGVQTQPFKMVSVQRIACCSVSKIGARQADRSDAATEPIDLSDGDRPGDSLHGGKRRAIPSLCRERWARTWCRWWLCRNRGTSDCTGPSLSIFGCPSSAIFYSAISSCPCRSTWPWR